MLCCDSCCYCVNICAVMAAVVVLTSLYCDWSCCHVNITCAVMAAVVV